MWVLRRALIPLKERVLSPRVSIAFANYSDPPSSYSEDNNGSCESAGANLARRSLCSDRFHIGRRCLSSKAARVKISGADDDDVGEGFSGLEMALSDDEDDAIVDQNDEDANDDEGLPSDSSDVEETCQNELELDTETDTSEKELQANRVSFGLFNAIVAAPGLSLIHSAIDRWINEGNELGRRDYVKVMLNLRKRRLYGKALKLSEWLEKSKKFDLIEKDYASRIDLIAELHGLNKAEQYIEMIPKSFRGEVVYRTLLATAVASSNLSRAEEIFYKMKELDFPLTNFACDQMLLLYKRLDKEKIGNVLVLMEKENLKPTLFTYRTLISAKALSKDMSGINQIVETMKELGIEPDISLKATLAKHYINAGRKEKAKALLEKIESDYSSNPKQKRWSSRFFLPLYAALGKPDDVQRIWKLYESNPSSDLSLAAIKAWGKLNKVEEAEAEFNKLVKAKKVGSKHYCALLNIYASHKMLTKGKELVKLMSDRGCPINQWTLDALVKLYIDAGEIEKVDSILHEAIQKNRMKPFYRTYMMIMDEYAKRGDIHNTENIFYKMRQQAGYVSRLGQFQALITAYMNARAAPLYGIRERMKVDNMFANGAMAAQLAQLDAFRKTDASELLD